MSVKILSKTAYLESLALGLVIYAQHNPRFLRYLELQIAKLAATSMFVQPKVSPSLGLLIPGGELDAVAKTQWLMNSKSNAVASLLKTWKKTKPWESPKQIIIGLAVGVIPGITLGKLSRNHTMSVVIRQDFADSIDIRLVEKINQAGLELIAKALNGSGGNLARLEPEMAVWLLEERSFSYFSADAEKIKHIADELNSLDIAHALLNIDNKPAILAISPAVNYFYQQMHWNLTPFS